MEHLVQILENERGEALFYNVNENRFCMKTTTGYTVSVGIRSFLKTLDGTRVALCEGFLPFVQKHIGKLRTERHAPEAPVVDVVIGAGVPEVRAALSHRIPMIADDVVVRLDDVEIERERLRRAADAECAGPHEVHAEVGTLVAS
jgi:hypothetical protein